MAASASGVLRQAPFPLVPFSFFCINAVHIHFAQPQLFAHFLFFSTFPQTYNCSWPFPLPSFSADHQVVYPAFFGFQGCLPLPVAFIFLFLSISSGCLPSCFRLGAPLRLFCVHIGSGSSGSTAGERGQGARPPSPGAAAVAAAAAFATTAAASSNGISPISKQPASCGGFCCTAAAIRMWWWGPRGPKEAQEVLSRL